MGATFPKRNLAVDDVLDWTDAHVQIARMTSTIKLDKHWVRFQLAHSAPPLSVTESDIAPSARMPVNCKARFHAYAQMLSLQ